MSNLQSPGIILNSELSSQRFKCSLFWPRDFSSTLPQTLSRILGPSWICGPRVVPRGPVEQTQLRRADHAMKRLHCNGSGIDQRSLLHSLQVREPFKASDQLTKGSPTFWTLRLCFGGGRERQRGHSPSTTSQALEVWSPVLSE